MIEFVFGVALLVSYVLLFYNYHLTGRKALFYYALAWVSLSVPFFVPRESVYMTGLAVFAFLIWLGNIKASDELLCSIKYSRELRYFSVVPIAGLLFLFPKHLLASLAVLSISVMFAGTYLILTGNSDFKLMGSLEVLFGVVSFFRGYYFSNLPLSLVEAVLAFVLAYVSIKAFLDSSFIGEFGEMRDVKTKLKPGVVMLNPVPEDILEGALVFSRKKNEAPNWFWITTVSSEGIAPTNLPKMLDIAVKFMKMASEHGKHPVIVIDGLEYLTLQNGFPAVTKFLATLRDYALLHNATVIISGDDSFLDERERAILRKLLDWSAE
ncbi:hypothetical protein TEU_02405 [Thermococcus eurythermalis]|uniref:DUF835 domain-containing protein n=1 Tax=Thermococcus eurythermalis TaxID=1505907 RepID=A0A097QS42_9EURY|nr:DUF835 domain-containing protein [Thermococcus eurythermalis]AIU69284.1 hypothetical protein TEU_02405 [Thermococcus eurythermalis]